MLQAHLWQGAGERFAGRRSLAHRAALPRSFSLPSRPDLDSRERGRCRRAPNARSDFRHAPVPFEQFVRLAKHVVPAPIVEQVSQEEPARVASRGARGPDFVRTRARLRRARVRERDRRGSPAHRDCRTRWRCPRQGARAREQSSSAARRSSIPSRSPRSIRAIPRMDRGANDVLEPDLAGEVDSLAGPLDRLLGPAAQSIDCRHSTVGRARARCSGRPRAGQLPRVPPLERAPCGHGARERGRDSTSRAPPHDPRRRPGGGRSPLRTPPRSRRAALEAAARRRA